MRQVRYMLKIIGAWPVEEIGDADTKNVFYRRCYTFFMELICVIPGIIFLKNNVGVLSFFELGHTYITVFMNMVAISRLVLIFLKAYRNIARDFITVLHLFNHKDKSEYAMETHILVHKISHFFTLYLNFTMFIALMLFNFIPLYNNICSGAFRIERPQNITYQQAVYYALPFDYTHQFKGFLAVFIFNSYISYICSSCICTMDLFLSLIVFHLWGHLRLLTYNLEYFPRPKGRIGNVAVPKDNYMSIEWFSDEELKDVFYRLSNIIRHHCMITDFTGRVSKIFGPILLIYYLFHQVNGCILLLECSQMDLKALVRYGPLMIVTYQQLIQISIIFELLESSSQRLMNAIYALPWECMDTRNRKIVYLLLIRAQQPISLKAMGMITVGVKTMISILKTSFTYFLMLRTFANNK